jgi:hypothetical protein
MSEEEYRERLLIENTRLRKHSDMLMMTTLVLLAQRLKAGEVDYVHDILIEMAEHYKIKMAKE